MEGLQFLGDVLPKDGEDFEVRKVYQYRQPNYTDQVSTIIELELFESNVCLLSFYERGATADEDKYKQRLNLKPGHARSIFRACLEAYYPLEGPYALMFSAANDPERVEETNGRFSLYKLFLNRYFKDLDKHEYRECSILNTLIVYEPDLPKKEEALDFYLGFEKRVKSNLEKEVTKEFNPLSKLPKEFFENTAVNYDQAKK